MVLNYLQTMGLGTVVGIGLGITLTKGGLTKSQVVRGQFDKSELTWYKVFCTTAGLGTMGLVARTLFHPSPLYIKPFYPYANVVGGAILGAGMYITGSNPTISIAKLGLGDSEAPWIVSGGIAGALVYGIIDNYLKVNTFIGNGGELCILSQKLGYPFVALAIPISAAFIGGSLLLESMYPETPMKLEDEDEDKPWITKMIKTQPWQPFITGAAMAFLQMPSLWLAHSALSASSAFTSIAGHIVELCGFQNAHFGEFLYNRKSYWHIAIAFGVAVGCFIAKQNMMKHKKHHHDKSGPLSTRVKSLSFIGGFLLLFGSRMANGCDYDHTSGLTQLACSSFVSIASICAGGMIAAAIPSFLI